MQIFQEFAKNPQETMQKYSHVPEFKETMTEFSQLMASHFSSIAENKEKERIEAEEKAKREYEQKLKEDPAFKAIETDP